MDLGQPASDARLIVSKSILIAPTQRPNHGYRMKLPDSLPFIEKLPHYKSSQEVGVAFADFVAPYGFTATACGDSRDTPEGRRWEFFFNTWPPEWLMQYQQNDFVRHDLLPMVARFSTQTFTWLEAIKGRTPTAKQREHHEWAKAWASSTQSRCRSTIPEAISGCASASPTIRSMIRSSGMPCRWCLCSPTSAAAI
ncbi:MAG: autoinducer binding domain-containing protein [Bradyrhizobium sp.]